MSALSDSSVFLARRQQLLKKLPESSVALIASGEEQIRNRDVDYTFRPHSDFHYLTGFDEPEALLCLIKHQSNTEQLLFVRPKDPLKETWEGRRLGVAAAVDYLLVDEAFSIDEVDEKLHEFLTDVQNVFVSFADLSDWFELTNDLIQRQKSKSRQGVEAPKQIVDLDSILHEMRLFKSADELALMRKAAQISVQGHLAAMKFAVVNGHEYQVQAEIEATYRKLGSERKAFNTIVASGDNACILHYTENRDQILDNQLVLVDSGAEYQGYAGDITHTFPANGKFTEAQAALYQIVLDAQRAAIQVIKVGAAYSVMHQAAAEVITRGLLNLGILTGDYETLLAEEAYKTYFLHGTGHWLGRDVHDVGAYKTNGDWRALQAGMVLTVEPGIYIPQDCQEVDDAYCGIGIRIEDDVLVTEQGAEILTLGLPREIKEIEQWMQTHR